MTMWSTLLAGMLAGWGADEVKSNVPTAVESSPATPASRVPPLSEPVETAEKPTTHNAPLRSGTPRLTPRSSNSSFIDRARKRKDEAQSKTAPSSRRVGWWTSTAIGLVVVLVVIYASGRAMRKMVPGMAADESSGPIHLLYRMYLAPKQAVCLIRCGNRLLLLGTAGDRMATLAEITDPEEIDYIKGQCMQVRPHSATKAFRDLFQRQRDSYIVDSPEESGDASNDARRESTLSASVGAARDKILQWKSRSIP